jgi:hypothetical protein
MEMRLLCLARLALSVMLGVHLGCNVAGQPSSDQGTRSAYREIRSVTIETQAKAAPGADPKMCSAFRLTAEQVSRFIARGDEVDVRSYATDLEYAPCSVEGTLTLNNGLTARWEIEMSARGRVVFEDDHIMLLHCTRCNGPFAR